MTILELAGKLVQLAKESGDLEVFVVSDRLGDNDSAQTDLEAFEPVLHHSSFSVEEQRALHPSAYKNHSSHPVTFPDRSGPDADVLLISFFGGDQ